MDLQDSSLTEVDISISRRQFRTALQIDGELRQSLVFDSIGPLATWASWVEQTAGEDLYIRLRLHRYSDMNTALQLAYAFHQNGLMTGIILENPICRCRHKGLH